MTKTDYYRYNLYNNMYMNIVETYHCLYPYIEFDDMFLLDEEIILYNCLKIIKQHISIILIKPVFTSLKLNFMSL